jgi:DNA polymerase V
MKKILDKHKHTFYNIAMEKKYMCIDLKSFYASVECNERNLNPMTTNLIVADPTRTAKTICLAVSPALKQYGIPGRIRLFELIQKVNKVNSERKIKAKNHEFTGKSVDSVELKNNPNLKLDYIIAKPRMSLYMKYSTTIYNVYLKYFSNDDMFPYSIDEVFFDITNYLAYYKITAEELATKVILDVLNTTGITATCGIGTNMYLAKIAMDVWAKHQEPDKNGVRMAELDEMSYRKLLWNHRPIKDFWRVGTRI